MGCNSILFYFMIFQQLIIKIKQKKGCIRVDHINFDNYFLFELKVTRLICLNLDIIWWKIEFRPNLIDVLSKKWAADLPDFYMVVEKNNNLCEDFNPTNYFDNETYFKKLVRIAKKINKKEERRQKRHTHKKFQTVKPLCWQFFYFLVFLFFYFYFIFFLLVILFFFILRCLFLFKKELNLQCLIKNGKRK